tara:strand:- start:39991 stop:40545 length:555 start_codon:yes stop_codon:yes gene_type:complete
MVTKITCDYCDADVTHDSGKNEWTLNLSSVAKAYNPHLPGRLAVYTLPPLHGGIFCSVSCLVSYIAKERGLVIIDRAGGELDGLLDVMAERARQVIGEGWTAEHDDSHRLKGELAMAAACYAAKSTGDYSAESFAPCVRELKWPFPRNWWKPKDRRRDLVRACALILAEIERLDRMRVKGPVDE